MAKIRDDLPWMTTDMRAEPREGFIAGACAKCGKAVWEALYLLDDAYNVWKGVCPHCGAINFLAMTSLRGYSSAGMDLVLPTDEEREANGLPADTPTSGPAGVPATPGGSVSEKICLELGKNAKHPNCQSTKKP